MARTVLIYGVALALGALALQWLHDEIWMSGRMDDVYIALVAVAFLGLGVWLGIRVFRPSPRLGAFAPNLQAQSSLGITEREYEVLRLVASGLANKDIARQLDLSPNTVKTHVARLFEKLDAARRTEAVLRARELGLIP